MTTALLSQRYGHQPEPGSTDEQAEPSTSAVRGGASLEESADISAESEASEAGAQPSRLQDTA